MADTTSPEKTREDKTRPGRTREANANQYHTSQVNNNQDKSTHVKRNQDKPSQTHTLLYNRTNVYSIITRNSCVPLIIYGVTYICLLSLTTCLTH